MMGRSGLRILSALLIIFVGSTLYGCKSKNSASNPISAAPAAPEGPDTPNTNPEEGQPAITEPPVNPDGPLLTVAEYEARYNPALLGAQSTYQKIRRDEIYGELTPQDAARQRICAHCQSDCLLEKYRDPEPNDNEKKCGNHDRQLIEYDIFRFPDLVTFYEQTCSDTPDTNQQLIKAEDASRDGLLKSVEVNPRSPAQLLDGFFGYQEITTQNGQITFTVRADDKTDNECEYKQIDTQTRVFTPGGPIDVYHRSQDTEAFNSVVSALSNPQFWTFCNEVFGQCETNSYYNHENPSVFLIGAIMGGYGGLHVSNPNAGRGYIIIDSGNPSAVCQRRSSSQEGGGGGGEGGGAPPVNVNIDWFLRPDYPSTTSAERYQETTVHELFHFAEMSHFSSDKKFHHPFIESFADWMGKLVYLNTAANHHTYVDFLYYPHFSFDDHSIAKDKEYAASVFWGFVSCHAGRAGQPKTTPIKKYEACIDGLSSFGKADYRKCAKEGIKYGQKGVAKILLDFGESVLWSSGDEGFTGMEQCDPKWQSDYLPGAIHAAPHYLIDVTRYASQGTATNQTPEYEFDLTTWDFSVTYHVFINGSGDTLNNDYKFDLGRCASEDVECSLFGYSISDDNDRSGVSFSRYRVPDDGKKELKFKGLDYEDDIIILVAADGRTNEVGVGRGNPAYIQTKPFSTPVDFSMTLTDRSGDDQNYTNMTLTFEGTLDVPDEDFPTRKIEADRALAGPDWFAFYYLDPDAHSPPIEDSSLWGFVPLKSGEFRWNFESQSVTTEGSNMNPGCPGLVTKTVRTTSTGTRPMSLDAGDSVNWEIWPKETPEGSGNYEGRMSFEARYHEGSFTLDGAQRQVTCSRAGCCRDPADNRPPTLPNTSAEIREAPFFEGELSQELTDNQSTPSRTYETMATITYPERVEMPRFWDSEGFNFEYGRLRYGNRNDDLMWQLVPEIIDFPRVVVPSRLARRGLYP